MFNPLNPLGILGKYLDLAVVAFVVFSGTLGSVWSAMMANGLPIWLSFATGCASGCLMMAGAVLLAAEKAGIKMPIPPGLRNVIAGTDLSKVETPMTDEAKRILANEGITRND